MRSRELAASSFRKDRRVVRRDVRILDARKYSSSTELLLVKCRALQEQVIWFGFLVSHLLVFFWV